jgi:hypothetical protein
MFEEIHSFRLFEHCIAALLETISVPKIYFLGDMILRNSHNLLNVFIQNFE